MIDFCYWLCFGYLIVISIVRLYAYISIGFLGCNSLIQKIGRFFGIIVFMLLFVGIIYFYLH